MRLLLSLLVCLSSIYVSAQKGKIEGKVTDSKTGAVITGVSVMIDGTKAGVSTNTDGYFILTVDISRKHTITLSSINYKSKEITDIEVTANNVTYLDIILENAAKTEAEVVVKSSSLKKLETSAALIAYQKNTPVVAQVISAEAIRRSPDKNTGEVLKRVPEIGRAHV